MASVATPALGELHLNLSQSGFELLHNFVVQETNIMISDCPQPLFKQDNKDRSRESLANKNFLVHGVSVELEKSLLNLKFLYHVLDS